jgi:hypothetical protein
MSLHWATHASPAPSRRWRASALAACSYAIVRHAGGDTDRRCRVSIPHVVGTAARFWLLRGQVDRRLLVRFGLTSAAGGLTGALLPRHNTRRAARALADDRVRDHRVVCGTLFGHRVLMRIPEEKFRPTAGLLLAVLGAAMLIIGIRSP